jgi:hypothetical protein
MLDIDGKRFEFEEGRLTLFILIQIVGIVVCVVGFSFINEFKYSAPVFMLVPWPTCLGAFKMIYAQEENLYEIIITNQRAGAFFSLFSNCFYGLFFFRYLLFFGQNEIIKMWLDRN